MKHPFSVRDVLWLALVAALTVGWLWTHRTLTKQLDANNVAITALEVKCNELNGEVEFLKGRMAESREEKP